MTTFPKAVCCVLTACVLFLAAAGQVGAVSPYQGYVYDMDGNDILSINPYLYYATIDGTDMETGPLNGPADLFAAPDDSLYIVDSGNNRVLHIDKEQRVLGVYGDSEGPGKLNGPKGVFVDAKGIVYVADTLNHRIVLFDATGAFVREYGAPDSPLLQNGFVYSPSKLIVDKRGYLFVVSEGAFQGLLQLKPDGKFAGFFGANPSPYSWTRTLVKMMATEQQKQQLASVRPPEFSNLFQDREGFIYTTTFGIDTNQVKRLSAVGVDTLNMYTDKIYGDLYLPIRNYEELRSTIVDVSVSAEGFITVLDQTTGRLYQYDKLGDMLFAFGGFGDQNGLFKTPSSVVQTSDGLMYVADSTRNRIDVFNPTPFALLVQKASALYAEGKYVEAFKPWQRVLALNSNYDLAYYSIGKALFREQRYKEAMDYFKIVGDQGNYSNAFREYRKEWIRQHFGTLMAILLTLVVVFVVIRRIVRKAISARRSGRKERSHGEYA